MHSTYLVQFFLVPPSVASFLVTSQCHVWTAALTGHNEKENSGCDQIREQTSRPACSAPTHSSPAVTTPCLTVKKIWHIVLEVDEGGQGGDAVVVGSGRVGDFHKVDSTTVTVIVNCLQGFQDLRTLG